MICLLALEESHRTESLILWVLRSGESISPADRRILVKRRGEPLAVVGRIVPIADKGCAAQEAIVLLWDGTEQQRIEAELLSAKEDAAVVNRIKTEFLAGMSYEFFTPPTGLIYCKRSRKIHKAWKNDLDSRLSGE